MDCERMIYEVESFSEVRWSDDELLTLLKSYLDVNGDEAHFRKFLSNCAEEKIAYYCE